MAKDLPALLHKYKECDFITQERTRFVYYLFITIFLTVLLAIFLLLVMHPLIVSDDQTQKMILLPLVILLILVAVYFRLLINGFYNLASNLLPATLMIAFWWIMFSTKGSSFVRMHSIVILFMVFSILPVLIGRFRLILLIYTVSNILMTILFAYIMKHQDHLANDEIAGYLIEVCIALAFVGILGYSIQSINKKALKRTESDSRERIWIEKEFTHTKRRYQELTELLPITVYETDLTGRIMYTNQAGYDTFGYRDEDIRNGVQVSELVEERETIASNMSQIMEGDRSGHPYTAIKKNGEKFPVEIFSSVISTEGKVTGFRGVIIDMTDRMKAEEALQISERKFREMTFLLPQTIYESDLKGNITFINQAGTTMFGFTDEDIKKGVNVLETIAEEDHERVRESIRSILGGKSTKGNQYMGRRKDGTFFPMQIHSNVIIQKDKITGFRGVIFDITTIKEVENELRQSNELFKTLIESIPIPTTLSDMDGKFLMVNKAFCVDIGMTREEVLGRTIHDLGIYTEEGKEEIINQLLDKHGFIENYEISTRSKKGQHHILYIYAAIVSVNNRKVLLRSTVNVTEKKQLENKLRESEALFRTIVNMVPYTITIHDSAHKFTFANESFLNNFHLDMDEIKGKTLDELGLHLNEEKYQEYLEELKKNSSVMNMEIDLLTPDLKSRYALLSVRNISIDDQPHFIATTVDITERKLLEKQLMDYNLHLEELVKIRTEELISTNEELSATNEELFGKNEMVIKTNRELNEAIELIRNTQLQLIQTEKMASLGILTAGVAHEVNNPLNYLMGVYVGLEDYFQEHGSQDTRKIEILLNSMRIGIERISNIVKGLNQFSRDNESLEEICDIHSIINNCISVIYNQLKHKATLAFEFHDQPITVKGNTGRLHQVFVNILLNAVQAIPKKGTIHIRTFIKTNKVFIEITDNGMGIEKENLARITDPFFTTKPPGEGTGLGLSISQTIVKEHQGEMHFESEINKGTKVILSFPLNQTV